MTVDCGIRSLDEVALANSLGMDVIVTDHHGTDHNMVADDDDHRPCHDGVEHGNLAAVADEIGGKLRRDGTVKPGQLILQSKFKQLGTMLRGFRQIRQNKQRISTLLTYFTASATSVEVTTSWLVRPKLILRTVAMVASSFAQYRVKAAPKNL